MGVWYLSTTRRPFTPPRLPPDRGTGWGLGVVWSVCGADSGHGLGVASHHVCCRTEQSSPRSKPLSSARGPEWRGDGLDLASLDSP